MRCVIADCPNASKTVRLRHPEKRVYFHRFPQNKSARKLWVEKCGREVNGKSTRICSEHFREEDYQRDLKNELLGLPIQRRLKPTAVPSLRLPLDLQRSSRNKHQEVAPKKSEGEEENDEEEIQIIEFISVPNTQQCYEELLNKYETVIKENKEIKEELDECRTKIAKVERDLVNIGSQFMLEKERRIQMENALRYLCDVSEIKVLIVE